MNHHTIIEVPAGKHFFTIEELPRLFADSVPDPADTVEGNWAVRIVMAQSEFLPLIEAAAVDGSLPALDPFTRLPARHPKGFNAKRLLVTLDAFRDFASKHGFDVREKAEPLQAQQAPEPPETPQATINAQEGSAGTDRTALMARYKELLAANCKNHTSTLAKEFRISDSRVRAIKREEKERAKPRSAMGAMTQQLLNKTGK